MLAPRPRRRRPRVVPEAKRRRQLEIARAWADPVAFVEYVFQVKLDPVQVAWIRYWQAHEASVLHAGVGIGKTTMARGLVLWMMGRDPGLQVIWLGATQRQPKDQLHSMKALIENKTARSRLHHVFPRLRPGSIWTSTEIVIEREASGLEASPTIAVYGAYSESVLGSRATLLVIDDLCNFNNTLTPDGREKMIAWLGTVLSRLTRDDVKFIVLGNYWHKADALMDLHVNKGFAYRKDPAFIRGPDDEWIMTCPSALSEKAARKLAKKLGPTQARQMLECEKPDANLGRFKEVYFHAALERGLGLEFRPARVHHPTFTGVDMGHRKKPGADRTAMVTAQLLPDGRKQIVDIRSGIWSGPEMKSHLIELRQRYGAQIGVENNGAQKIVMDLITDMTAIPLLDHNTNVNKRDLVNGVEGLANELSQGAWVFPCPHRAALDPRHGLVEDDGRGEPHEEIQALVGEALAYDPTRPTEHTGDRLMAWWILNETIRKSSVFAYDDVVASADVPRIDWISR